MLLTLRALGPDTLHAWLAFMDGPAFADNRDWGTCYCRAYLFAEPGPDAWDRACATPGLNRSHMIERIGAGTVDGLLAFRDGEAVGWTHYGATSRFPTLLPADDGVASIVCFVVAEKHRRSGVARGLLRGACDDLSLRGFGAVDARPGTLSGGPAMEQFRGPLALYLSEGFSVAEEGAKWVRVRRPLTARPAR